MIPTSIEKINNGISEVTNKPDNGSNSKNCTTGNLKKKGYIYKAGLIIKMYSIISLILNNLINGKTNKIISSLKKFGNKKKCCFESFPP